MPSRRDWEYSQGAHRYRDLRNGRFVSQSTIIQLRDNLVDSRLASVNGLAELLARGDLSIQRWTLEMRDSVKLTQVTEYVFGRGGVRAMTAADWGKVGANVRAQYEYLQGFAQDIVSGRYSDPDGELKLLPVQARARMYINAGVNAYSLGVESTWPGELALPAHPGDGGTPCLTNCSCHWSINETQAEWRATWVLGRVEHCDGCETRRQTWNPYVQAKATSDAPVEAVIS